jgi:hypothetical protein
MPLIPVIGASSIEGRLSQLEAQAYPAAIEVPPGALAPSS